MDLTKALIKLGKCLRANKKSILMAGALGGVAVTAAVALEEGPAIKQIIEEEMRDLELTPKEDKETRRTIYKETVRKLAPRVLKVILTAALTMSAIYGLNSEHKKDYMAAATLAAVSQQKLKEYEDVAKEVIGEKKVDAVKQAYAEKKVKEQPKYEQQDPFDGHGVAVYDWHDGFKFHVKDRYALEEARLTLQSRLTDDFEPFVTINDFYEACIGYYIHIPYASDKGWNQGTQVDIEWRSGEDHEGNMCYCLEYTPQLKAQKTFGDITYYDEAYY